MLLQNWEVCCIVVAELGGVQNLVEPEWLEKQTWSQHSHTELQGSICQHGDCCTSDRDTATKATTRETLKASRDT